MGMGVLFKLFLISIQFGGKHNEQKSKLSLGFIRVAASLVTLAACNNNKANNAGGESAAKASERKFPTELTNEGTPIKGGTINYAIVSASPLKG